MGLKKKLKEKVTFKLDFNFGGKVLHVRTNNNNNNNNFRIIKNLTLAKMMHK